MWSDPPDAARVAAARDVLRRLPLSRPAPRGLRPLTGVPVPELWVESLRDADGRSIWLDGGSRGRHILAAAPVATLEVRANETTIVAGGERSKLVCGPFDLLAAVEAELGDHGGRWFGWIGYEAAQDLERLPPPVPRDIEVPDLWLGMCDAWIECRGDRATLVTDGDRWTAERVEAFAGALERIAAGPAGRGEGGAPASRPLAGRLQVRPDDTGYEAAVERTVAAIVRGDLFQTNLCRRFEVTPAPPPSSLYRRLRAAGDAAYGAAISTPAAHVLSRSPECFLSVRGDRIESRPIKGTRPRGADPSSDAALREDLRGSAKDAAELAMIVDLVRNDLGRVCRPGSVQVAEHRELMELAGVWHTYSRVVGRLSEGIGATEILRATFPPGSITGAPKIQAMTVAAEEEPTRRGPAMGAIGWIDPGGDMELSVAIRTAVADGDRVVYHAGCGIVADSTARQEREESEVKARAFLRAFDR